MKNQISTLALIFFSGVLAAQKGQAFSRDFNAVGAIYEKHLLPRLTSLVEKQLSPFSKGDSSEGFDVKLAVRASVLDTRVKTLMAKAETLRAEGLKLFLEAITDKKPSREAIVNYYTNVYQFEFPGLEYEFFQIARKESLSALAK